MNQPPNTTSEKSVCCGAIKGQEYDSDFPTMYRNICSKCYKDFAPTPSVCEVAKGECMKPHCKCMQNYPCSNHHYSDCRSTEPKKTVEKKCNCAHEGRMHKQIEGNCGICVNCPIQHGCEVIKKKN